MANRYWVNINAGADGNWDTASTTCWSATDGGPTGASAPTAGDNVFFTALSGNARCLINVGLCLNIDTTGYTGTFAWSSNSSLLRIYGNTTFTVGISGANTTGGVRYMATSGSYTISSGTSFGTSPVQIGPGSGTARYDLTSNFSCSTLTVAGGGTTFFSQGFTINSSGQITVNSGAQFNPGTSTINCTSWSAAGSGVMLSAANSTINCTSDFISTSTNTYGNVVITPTVTTLTISTTSNYSNLTIDYSNNVCPTTTIAGTHTISGTFTVIGNNRYPKIQNGTFNAANANISNVLFKNTSFAGAATWSGTNIGKWGAAGTGSMTYTAGGTNICTASGSQNWYNPAIWSLGRVPLPADDVIIRSISSSNLQFTNTINTFPVYINSFKLETTSTGGVDFTLASDFYITGGLQFDAGTFMPKGAIVRPSFTTNGYAAVAGNYNITNLAGSNVQLQNFSVNDTFSTYTITDNLSMNGALQLLSGTLIINDNITVDFFNFFSTSSTVRTWTIGNNVTLLCGRNWSMHPTNLTAPNLVNTPITIFDTSSTAISFGSPSGSVSAGFAYGEVSFPGGSTNISMYGANTFKKLTVNKNVQTTLGFHGGVTTTIESPNISGKVGATLFLVVSAGSSGTATIARSGTGIVSANYLNINNVSVTPTTDTWYAGANSTSSGGTTTGWIFTAPPGTSVNSLFFGSFF